MKKKEEVKCRYSHCKHGGMVRTEEAVRDGNMYYHRDCYEEKNNIQQIIDVYVKRVDPKPIFTELRKTINDLIYKDGYASDYFLFALNYCLDHGWNLRHVPGLRYAVRNTDAQDAWKRKASAFKVQAEQFDIPTESFDFDINVTVNVPKQKSFADILRG